MNKECYMLLAGKNATYNGSMLSGHNNDLQGHHAAQFELLKRAKHLENDFIKLPSGLEIPLPEETQKCLILKTWRGYAEGDAVAVNEYQVAIAGGVDLGYDRNQTAKKLDPLIPNGVSGAVRYIALQQSRTAKECVEKIGSYYSTYGISYPCGVGVVDTNEAWYIEVGGGKNWIAVRVPDDCYLTQANSYRISEVDVEDKSNVICSPGLIDFLVSNDIWTSSRGKFNFAKTFGGAMQKNADFRYFNSRRIWGCLRKLSPSMNFDPDAIDFPMFVRPDKKLTPESLMDVLRDSYDDTIYYLFSDDGTILPERSICVPSCVHSDVIELRGWLPPDIGAVIWGALASPGTSPYIPYYFGTTDIFTPYAIGGPTYDNVSAFWKLRSLSNLAMFKYKDIAPIIQKRWAMFEENINKTKLTMETVAIEKYKEDPLTACNLLSNYSNCFASESYGISQELESEVQTYIAQHVHLIFSKPGLDW